VAVRSFTVMVHVYWALGRVVTITKSERCLKITRSTVIVVESRFLCQT
jgi:hypothetical protein